MPDLAGRLRADQIAARKAVHKDRTLLLGTVLAALKNKEIELGREPDDAEVIELIRRQIKQRQDSVEQFTAGGRGDLAAREAEEQAVLQTYLPADVDPREIRAAADRAIADGATNLGTLMGVLMAGFRGKTDGSVINQIAREALQQK